MKNLLWAALLHADKMDLLRLADNTLSKCNAVKGTSRLLWYGVAFYINPSDFVKKIQKYIGTDYEKGKMFLSFLIPTWPEGRNLLKLPELSLLKAGYLLSICGKAMLSGDQKDHRGQCSPISGTGLCWI